MSRGQINTSEIAVRAPGAGQCTCSCRQRRARCEVERKAQHHEQSPKSFTNSCNQKTCIYMRMVPLAFNNNADRQSGRLCRTWVHSRRQLRAYASVCPVARCRRLRSDCFNLPLDLKIARPEIIAASQASGCCLVCACPASCCCPLLPAQQAVHRVRLWLPAFLVCVAGSRGAP